MKGSTLFDSSAQQIVEDEWWRPKSAGILKGAARGELGGWGRVGWGFPM